MISIKTKEEIAKMRKAGLLAYKILEMIQPHIKVGITTFER